MQRWWLAPALVGGALVWAALDLESGLSPWLRLRADLVAAHARIDGLRDEIASLRRETAALESDAFAIERAIREDLELARPGETLIRLPRSDTNARFP